MSEKKGGEDSAKVAVASTHDGDSTLYGVCGTNSCNDSMFLVQDNNKSVLVYLYPESVDSIMTPESEIYGGVVAGSKMALTTYKDGTGKIIGKKVINISTIQGRWTNKLDRDFSLDEDGKVSSHIKNEENPYKQWKIHNGNLIIDGAEFSIVELTSQRLAIEDSTGIYEYTRIK